MYLSQLIHNIHQRGTELLHNPVGRNVRLAVLKRDNVTLEDI